ncbi:MAG: site-specific integrase [Flavobacterium lindanitolerans]|jgi:site-specific recombinase XerD|uniref:Site-specific integrase n=1 Tax=Flavobacterium microcysteis TaxID=2596891 RepID=A0A501Q100_9FLAO|nr:MULTISPECIES: site-specific integrase [Flavobacterium]MBL7869836.1 site-specific integrase [Flavobacterium lindanitolerans]MDL2143470.1 site-specific integrase [Flavobacterium tructae]TPD66014.1 site-specific integrase [Flavobacterium microcysteis]
MKTTGITFGVLFYLKTQKTTTQGSAPICARVTVNGKRTEISVKRSVKATEWDERKGMAKGGRKEIVELNMFLNQFKAKIINTYQQMVLSDTAIDGPAIRDKVLGTDHSAPTLISLMEYHNEQQMHKLAPGTMKNYHTTQRYVKKFLMAKLYRNDVLLSQLTYKFILDFERFLFNYVPKDHQKPLNNNGIMKHIERLRKMINMAVKLDWLSKDPFSSFKKHFDKVERKSLNSQELMALSNKEFTIERLRHVRDMFMFSCYTGLSYIELVELTPNKIITGIDGGLWISTSRAKTDTGVRVPLLPQATDLIEKYRDDPRALNNGTVFPVISNQRMNGYLKEIADLCGITKTLTYHIARHTFATTVTLSNGVPIESVSKMLGHTSIRTTQIYAKVVEHKLSEDMRNLEQRMSARV